MATISLYAGKVNQMSSLIHNVKRSVEEFKSDLISLNSEVLAVDSSVCNMDEVICSIRASAKIQEDNADTLETLKEEVNEFVSDVIHIDSNAADAINRSKDDFYNAYTYLKPFCEKNGWEKFKDNCKKVGEWCKEHWKEIIAVVVIIVGVVLCFIPGLNGIGVGILLGALKGAISGALIGGLSSWVSGGSFWEGMKDGAISGVIFGGVFGGIGAVGELIGNVKALTMLENGQWFSNSSRFLSRVVMVSKISGGITFALGSFDVLALGSKILFGDNWFSDFNASLHKSSLYNFTQVVIAGIAVFSGGMGKGFVDAGNQAGVKPSCFVAGTKILTAMGLVTIENIKAGQKVISTNIQTMENAEKTVLETYIREVEKLVHLTINGAEIITTVDHPFYVYNKGFINAGELWAGAKLLNAKGNLLSVKNIRLELVEKPMKVYNFQVEDFHTYYVGENKILVHNANNNYKIPTSGSGKEKSNDIPSRYRGERPFINESGKEFAKRLCDAVFGEGNYDTGPGSDYNILKKYGDRAFKNP